MLPDFPKAKALIGKRHLKRFYDVQSNNLGPIANMPQSPIHEGHRAAIIREDGTIDEMKWKKVTASEKINLNEIETWTDEQIYAHYERMAKQMAFQQKKLAYEKIGETAKSVGNEVSMTGKSGAEVILEIYDKMWIDFQEDGKHVPLTLVGGTEAQLKFQNAFQQLESDPELRKRFDELVRRKRNEWRERESSRKLVG